MNQVEVLHRIKQERKRQDTLHPYNNIGDYFVILSEEFLEVAMAMQGQGDLKEELIHVTSVCVRWLEEL